MAKVARGMKQNRDPKIIRCLLVAMRRHRLFHALILVIFPAALMLPGDILAGTEEEQFPDRFGIRLGGFYIKDADSTLREDLANSPGGRYVDFHDTLGGDNKTTVWRLDGIYRFNERHALTFSWYDSKFTGSTVLDQDLVLPRQTFLKGTQIASNLEIDTYKLSYQYSVYHNEKIELAISAGIHKTHVSESITASGTGQYSSSSINAPLPVLGLFLDYKITPRFSAFYNHQVFFVNYNDKIKGELQDLLFGLEYRVFRNVALGAAYNTSSIHLTVQKTAATFYFDANWSGELVYAAVYF